MSAFQANNNNNNKRNNYINSDNTSETGAWIGIDFGTTNCAAAVWDSTRGRPKVLRLGPAAIPHRCTGGGKAGRILPSIILLRHTSKNEKEKKNYSTTTTTNLPPNVEALVGHLAKQLSETQSEMENTENATVTSVKRLLGYHNNNKNDNDDM